MLRYEYVPNMEGFLQVVAEIGMFKQEGPKALNRSPE